MKTLLTTVALVALSSSAFAIQEGPEHAVPGYGVEIGQASNQQHLMSFNSDGRAEPLEYSVPGYGVEPGKASGHFASAHNLSSQPEVGAVDVDFLGLSFEGAF